MLKWYCRNQVWDQQEAQPEAIPGSLRCASGVFSCASVMFCSQFLLKYSSVQLPENRNFFIFPPLSITYPP